AGVHDAGRVPQALGPGDTVNSGCLLDRVGREGRLGQRLLDDPELRETMGRAARARAEHELSYDVLAARLWAALQALA
ncbi:MAG: hypothetical protein AB7V43_20015, partial [Acidimicrobiia bacterium]